jgi:hypothetical protein
MNTSAKTIAVLAGAALAAGLTGPVPGAAATAVRTVAAPAAGSRSGSGARSGSGSAVPVVEWNRQLISILGDPKAQPPTVHSTRSFAILAAAEYDAVMSITHAGRTYRVTVSARHGARADAAADQAAHDALAALYPTHRPALDQRLNGQLAAIPDGQGKPDGRRRHPKLRQHPGRRQRSRHQPNLGRSAHPLRPPGRPAARRPGSRLRGTPTLTDRGGPGNAWWYPRQRAWATAACTMAVPMPWDRRSDGQTVSPLSSGRLRAPRRS